MNTIHLAIQEKISFVLAKYRARRKASFYCHPRLTTNSDGGRNYLLRKSRRSD